MTVVLEVSAARVAPGQTVTVAVAAAGNAATGEIVGLQGALHFNPDRLRYTGQVLAERVFSIANVQQAARGQLRVASLEIGGLNGRLAYFVFQVLGTDYLDGLQYELEAAVDGAGQPARNVIVLGAPHTAGDLPGLRGAAVLTLSDWRRLLAPAIPRSGAGSGARSATPPSFVAGEYRPNLRYGDATLDGKIDLIGDAFYLANVSVGNVQMLAGSDAPPRDAVIAGNVAPANLPRLGEPDDLDPPGRSANGTFSIDIFDAVAVANEAVGNDVSVVGEIIPGRGPIPTERVIVTGTILTGTTRTLFRDTIYELHGTVNVAGSATLLIEAGTRIEGDRASRGALVVRRGGRLVAQGTRLQPIVFTCTEPLPDRGCWGGIVINGFSLLNNGQPAAGGVDVNGCPERQSIGNPGFYGGCLIADTSSALRYVRVEYAGQQADGSPTPGLALLGAGSQTVVESLQVHSSLGDGIFVSGGRVNLRNVVLSNNAGDGLRWDDGWQGKGQFLIVEQGTIGGYALHGSNFPDVPDAGPRSYPRLYNVTTINGGIRFARGSGGVLRNVVALQSASAGLEVDGTESCQKALDGLDSLSISHAIFFGGNPDFSTDNDCIDEPAYAADPGRQIRVLDPRLIAPFSTAAADFRPLASSPALVGVAAIPADAFFDGTAMYLGAVTPALPTLNNIPWYAGWVRGWSGSP